VLRLAYLSRQPGVPMTVTYAAKTVLLHIHLCDPLFARPRPGRRKREIREEDILYKRTLIEQHPKESRRKLSVRVFEAWQWRQANRRCRQQPVHCDRPFFYRRFFCRGRGGLLGIVWVVRRKHLD
jgi:hypothetical protein